MLITTVCLSNCIERRLHCTIQYEAGFHRWSKGHFGLCWKATLDVGKICGMWDLWEKFRKRRLLRNWLFKFNKNIRINPKDLKTGLLIWDIVQCIGQCIFSTLLDLVRLLMWVMTITKSKNAVIYISWLFSFFECKSNSK